MRLHNLLLAFLVSTSVFTDSAKASVIGLPDGDRYSLEAEGQVVWQGRNDAAIPGDTGSRFSLRDVLRSPVPGLRVELGYRLAERHQLRGVFAPLSLEDTGTLAQPVRFQNTVFSNTVPVDAVFKFNSYRVTYRYRFVDDGAWLLYGGLTAKVRDATISLRQGGAFEEKRNVGFVPLLHVAAVYRFNPEIQAELEADALAAPQGRAEDVRIGARWNFTGSGFSALLGYRILEGGADNSEVYTFALFHYLSAAVGFAF